MDTFAARYARLADRATGLGLDPAALVLPAEGVVRAPDGVGLHYLEWPGPTAEPLLLLLHGGGLNAHSFDLVGPLLRDVGRCVALDLRGHGESGWAAPGHYGSEAVVADVEAVVRALGASRVVLVAHSLGGIASIVWAGRRPALLAGLVVLDVGPSIDLQAGRSVNSLISSRPLFGDLDEAEAFVAGATHAGSWIAQNLSWTDEGLLTWKHDPAQFSAESGPLAAPDELRAAARRIACPLLVLRGARSRVFSAAGAGELAGLVPGARWEQVPEAGHTIQTSNPRGLAEAVHRFLRDHHLVSGDEAGVR
jgi:pimeloyl-ACP methyl ester carboxylesterase